MSGRRGAAGRRGGPHILGKRGRRITGLEANLAERGDPGLKKALALVRAR